MSDAARKQQQELQQRASAEYFHSYPIRLMSAIEASQEEAEERVEASAPFHYPSREDRRRIMRMIPGDIQLAREIVDLEQALTWARRAPRYVEPRWLRLLRWIERRL